MKPLFMKKLLLFPLLLLSSCAGDRETISVKQFIIRDQGLSQGDDPMVRQEKLRRLYGAVTMEERKEKLGQYYTVIWNSPATVGADREVRFDYLQAGSGSRIKTTRRQLSSELAKGKEEFAIIGDDYFKNGRVLAWKASYVAGGKTIASKQSYLWE